MDGPNNFEQLPTEMIEKIFSYLPDKSVLIASDVCQLWFQVAERIAINRCDHDLIHDFEGQSVISENPWLNYLMWKSMSELLLSGFCGKFSSVIPELYIEDEKHYALIGCYLIVNVKETSKIHIIDLQNFDDEKNSFPFAVKFPQMEYECGEGHIQQLHAVPNLNLLLVLSDKFEFYTLPNLSDEIHEVKKLDIITENYEYRKLDKTFVDVSIDGFMMAARTDKIISIFEMENQNHEAVRLKFVAHYQAPTAIYRFSLWKNFLTVLLETGYITRWSPNEEELIEGPYQEIRYRNPLWIFGDKMFCSTLRSREFLALWHLEYGTNYWLAGDPFVGGLQRYGSEITFVSLDTPSTDEITSVCLKHSLLFCGTARGNIAIYKSSDNFTNDNPRLVKYFSSDQIDGIKVDYTEDLMYVVLRNANKLTVTIIAFSEGELKKKKKLKLKHSQNVTFPNPNLSHTN